MQTDRLIDQLASNCPINHHKLFSITEQIYLNGKLMRMRNYRRCNMLTKRENVKICIVYIENLPVYQSDQSYKLLVWPMRCQINSFQNMLGWFIFYFVMLFLSFILLISLIIVFNSDFERCLLMKGKIIMNNLASDC